MKKWFALVSAGLLTACLEAQPAPELPTRPSTDFTIEIVTEGLNTPWSVTPYPGGGYLVTEKEGALKRIWPDGRVESVKGGPENVFTDGQAGLFDVIVGKNFNDTPVIYMSYAYGNADANGTAMFRASLPRSGTIDGADGQTLMGGEDIFRTFPPKDTASHFGGRIVEMPDGTFILTFGDGFAYREEAQNPESHLGKILRLTAKGQAEVYSLGHRNVQGAYYDSATDTLWAHEHGPRGGDELNLIERDQNYGWPTATTGRDYNGARISPFEQYEGMVDPVYDWVPSIAPSGLTIYRGDMFPNWSGDALVGGLARKSLRRVDLEKGKAVGEEILLADLNARIRDVRLDHDGAVILLTNTKKDMEPGGGQLLRLTPKN